MSTLLTTMMKMTLFRVVKTNFIRHRRNYYMLSCVCSLRRRRSEIPQCLFQIPIDTFFRKINIYTSKENRREFNRVYEVKQTKIE